MNIDEINEFERLQAQLQSLYLEMGTISKKKPDDAVNEFKLSLINNILERANSVLGDNYRPFDDFEIFNPDNVPTTSDVVIIVSQYLNCLEKLRADNIKKEDFGNKWYWCVDGKNSGTETGPPHKLKY